MRKMRVVVLRFCPSLYIGNCNISRSISVRYERAWNFVAISLFLAHSGELGCFKSSLASIMVEEAGEEISSKSIQEWEKQIACRFSGGDDDDVDDHRIASTGGNSRMRNEKTTEQFRARGGETLASTNRVWMKKQTNQRNILVRKSSN